MWSEDRMTEQALLERRAAAGEAKGGENDERYRRQQRQQQANCAKDQRGEACNKIKNTAHWPAYHAWAPMRVETVSPR